MEIPIQNIYYMLCYSWDKLEERDIVNVDATTCHHMVDLFAKILVNGCTHLLKRGLDRQYVPVSETVSGLRGRVDFGVSLKQQLFEKAQAHCTFDVFEHDVLHNRILKATLLRLIRTEHLDAGLRQQLKVLVRKLGTIADHRITTHDFSRVVLHRNNAFYDFLLKVCRIVHDHTLITEEQGRYKFRDFIRDEHKMRIVFEHFVRNFYRKEQQAYAVASEHIRWNVQESGSIALHLLPLMRTDISLTSATRKLIIDTKYSATIFSSYYDKESLRSPHLYQLYTYLQHIEAKGGLNLACEGMLLYPTLTDEVHGHYVMGAHPISVRTVNLNQHWERIHAELLALIA